MHRSGCGEWFVAERDTRTNEVHWDRAFADGGSRATGASGSGVAIMTRLPEQRGERIQRDTE